MNTSKIKVETSIHAKPEKVWEYYTIPKHISNWNFANDDWHCPKAENDLRVGGKLKYKMEAKDGSFGFDFEAIYDDIIQQQKLIYILEDGRVVDTRFEFINGETKIMTTLDAEKQNSLELQRGGWQAILNNFKKYVESN